MIHVPSPDAFAVFGVPRSLDLDESELEQRYLKLSRDCHPDHNRSQDSDDCIAVLQRSAEINDAWKVLRDPWRRARALLEAESEGVLERNKKLDPMFLAEALELAEQVALVEDEQKSTLRNQLKQSLADEYAAVRSAVDATDLDAAARHVHQSHYFTKALHDLESKS